MASGNGSLDGILVADFSHVLSGPYATMTLGDLGADIVRIEHPGGGDQTRGWGPPFYDGESAYFLAVNRNKRSAQIDLKDPAGIDVARRLLERADVVVQNFRPGVMEDVGLGYEDVVAINPRIIYCSISAFGTTDLGSQMPGYDLLVQAMSGLMSITGTSDGQPVKVGVAVADVIAGLNVTVGVLAALHRRNVTGVGQRVDVDLFSSMLAALVNQASTFLTGGGVPRAMGMKHPSIVPYELFPTATRSIIIAVGTDRQFRSLVDVLGLPEMAADDRFATNETRVRHRVQLIDRLGAAFLPRDADEVVGELTAAGVPCGPINTIAEAFDLAAKLGLDPVVDIPRPDGIAVPQVASPIRMSESPPTYRSPPPRLGADTAEILDRFGYEQRET
ncbi:MAG: CoA transferase [Nitriliruptoraceae bacterium]